MANKLYEETDIQNIADAIRAKNNSTDTYKVADMPEAIRNIPSEGGIVPGGTLDITQNGKYDITSYANVNVNVKGESSGSDLPSNIRTGTFTLEENTQESQVITHNAGVVPSGVFVLIDEMANPNAVATKTIGGMKIGRNEAIVFSNTGNVTYGAVTSISDITETTFTISPRNASSYPFAAGFTYRWWVWI